LEAAEFAEGVVVVALGGIDAALEAGEDVAVIGEDFAEGDIEDVPGVFEELGVDGAESAEEPLGIDEGVDEGGLGFAADGGRSHQPSTFAANPGPF